MKTIDPALKFACPACGARPRERCEMNTGLPSFESHAARRRQTESKATRPTADEVNQVGWGDTFLIPLSHFHHKAKKNVTVKVTIRRIAKKKSPPGKRRSHA